jgi:ATP-dependent HslUV protease ATP-binding subunit HslU
VIELAGPQGVEEMGINMKDMLGNLFQGRTKQRKMRVDEAMEYLMQEEEERLIDMDQVARAAIERVEIPELSFSTRSTRLPDASRDMGRTFRAKACSATFADRRRHDVNSRYGMVRTDHILFIAAGAFHVSKPSDLIPELQGRFPIRVELESLTIEDFKRILTEPRTL